MTSTHTTEPEEVEEPPQHSTVNIATPKPDEGPAHEWKLRRRLASQSGSTRHSAMLEAIYHWLHSR